PGVGPAHVALADVRSAYDFLQLFGDLSAAQAAGALSPRGLWPSGMTAGQRDAFLAAVTRSRGLSALSDPSALRLRLVRADPGAGRTTLQFSWSEGAGFPVIVALPRPPWREPAG